MHVVEERTKEIKKKTSPIPKGAGRASWKTRPAREHLSGTRMGHRPCTPFRDLRVGSAAPPRGARRASRYPLLGNGNLEE